MVKKTNAYRSDIFRTILKGRRRFFSIMIITALGVMMFSGLKAACMDLRYSADRFFDAQNLHDLQILSTLGFDDDDIKAIKMLEGVAKVSARYSEEVTAICKETELSVNLSALSEDDLDQPYLLEGSFPVRNNEAAMTERFAKDTGAKVGDLFRIIEKEGENETENFPVKEYTITALVTDVTDLNNPFGSVAYRDAAIRSDTVFIPESAVEHDLYTSVAVQAEDTARLDCFSSAYTDIIDDLKTRIEEEIQKDREKARTEKIRREAEEKVREAEEEILKELEEARKKLEDTLKEYNDGKKELDENSVLLAEGRRTAEKALADAQRLISENRARLEREKEAFEKTKASLLKQIEDLEKNKADLLEAKNGLAQLDEGIRQVEDGLAQLDSQEMRLLMELLEQLPEDTALEDLFETMEQISSLVSQLQESGLLPEEISAEEITQALEDAKTDLAADQAVLNDPLQTEIIGRLRQNEEDRLLEETEENVSLLLEVLAKYRPGREITMANELVETYDFAVRLCALGEEVFSSEEFVMAEDLLKLSEGTQDFSDLQEQIHDMPSQLAEAAGTQEPQTVSELVETWKAAVEKLTQTKEELTAMRADVVKQLEDNGVKEDEIDETIASIEDGIRQIREGIAYGEEQIRNGEAQLNAGQMELDANRISTLAALDDALRQIQEGYQKLREGKKELDDGWAQYYEGEAEAKEEFEEAYKTIREIDTAAWYIQDRMAMSGYANIDSDAGSIESIGTVFPIVFLVVAVLISLTTITRMVEEERGLIGTYKSLGYTDNEIRRKYLVYAALAVVGGAVSGTLMAFVALPLFIFTIFSIMYLLPSYELTFLPLYGLGGPLIFMAAILGAVLVASSTELNLVPAALMRPKAPKAGSRVFLERITPLWQRMSFLDKVTSRNLFRYKKRMFMTVFGIAGCMALLLFGFAIGDSVRDLMPRQYEQTFFYDIMAVARDGDHEELSKAVITNKDTEEYADVMITSAGLAKGEGRRESLQLIVLDDALETEKYFFFRDPDGNELKLSKNEIFVTQNAGIVLGFDEGETVSIQLADLQTASVTASHLVQNYLGNYVFMTRAGYETYFHDYMANGILVNLREGADSAAYGESLKEQPKVMSVLVTDEMVEQFSQAFRLINAVVYIVIAMSAALAFVVLFTLASINVSERTREIATIKVLGFFDHEVHAYIDKETVILTAIGIVSGIPLGRAFASTLTGILNLPSIYLAVSLHLKSYLIAIGLTVLFAVFVNLFCDRILDAVDPVEALKSVE